MAVLRKVNYRSVDICRLIKKINSVKEKENQKKCRPQLAIDEREAEIDNPGRVAGLVIL